MRDLSVTDPEFLASATFISVDIETTGLEVTDAITEIAAVKYRGGQVVDQFASLVNPGRPIPAFITRLTGIDDEMVAQAPSLELVLPQFLSFADFSSSVLLAHNARFDTRFLLRGCQQVGIEWPFPACLDTVLFSRAVLPRPQVHNHRLGTLAHHFGIENPQAHRALADAYTCLHLFEELVKLTHLNQVEIPDSVLTVLTEEVAFAG